MTLHDEDSYSVVSNRVDGPHNFRDYPGSIRKDSELNAAIPEVPPLTVNGLLIQFRHVNPASFPTLPDYQGVIHRLERLDCENSTQILRGPNGITGGPTRQMSAPI